MIQRKQKQQRTKMKSKLQISYRNRSRSECSNLLKCSKLKCSKTERTDNKLFKLKLKKLQTAQQRSSSQPSMAGLAAKSSPPRTLSLGCSPRCRRCNRASRPGLLRSQRTQPKNKQESPRLSSPLLKVTAKGQRLLTKREQRNNWQPKQPKRPRQRLRKLWPTPTKTIQSLIWLMLMVMAPLSTAANQFFDNIHFNNVINKHNTNININNNDFHKHDCFGNEHVYTNIVFYVETLHQNIVCSHVLGTQVPYYDSEFSVQPLSKFQLLF